MVLLGVVELRNCTFSLGNIINNSLLALSVYTPKATKTAAILFLSGRDHIRRL